MTSLKRLLSLILGHLTAVSLVVTDPVHQAVANLVGLHLWLAHHHHQLFVSLLLFIGHV